MLDLIAYDIGQPRSHRRLQRGIRACSADEKNVEFAPWFMDTPMGPDAALRVIRTNLGPGRARKDGLMVLSLRPGVSAAAHNAEEHGEAMRWLEDHGVEFRDTWSTGVVAITYTLHGAKRNDYTRLMRAIEREYPDHCKPVRALYFVATRETPAQVNERLKRYLADVDRDELLVLSVPRRSFGNIALKNRWINERVRDWFNTHALPVH